MDRDKAAQWLVQLSHTFDFTPETFVLAISIMDRVSQLVKVCSYIFILLGCFFLDSFYLISLLYCWYIDLHFLNKGLFYIWICSLFLIVIMGIYFCFLSNYILVLMILLFCSTFVSWRLRDDHWENILMTKASLEPIIP